MKPQDVKKYFGSGYGFRKETGMSAATLGNWLEWGYVPFVSQKKIEKITNKELKAVWYDEELERHEY